MTGSHLLFYPGSSVLQAPKAERKSMGRPKVKRMVAGKSKRKILKCRLSSMEQWLDQCEVIVVSLVAYVGSMVITEEVVGG